ncbi:MAG: ATP-binding protein [Xylophilus ampelinus]
MQPPHRFAVLTAWDRPAIAWSALAALALLVSALAYRWAEAQAFERLDDGAARQLDLYASVLENELGRHDFLPRLLQIDGAVTAFLAAPQDAALRDQANRQLTRFAVMSGVAVGFVLDARGTVVASSDWYQTRALVGRRLALGSYLDDLSRPDRVHPFPTRAVPPAGGRAAPDHCFAQELFQRTELQGVAVACVSLEPLEATWTGLAFPAESEKPFVVDGAGQVVLSSVEAWKFRWLAPSADAAGPVFRGPSDAPGAGGAGDMVRGAVLPHGGQRVRWAPDAAGPGRQAVLNELPVPRYGWRLMLVSDASEAQRSARNAAGAAGALTACAGLLLLHLQQRRRVVAQKLSARAQLEAAYAELERTVQLRTAELLHASKMALLGQLSAGISHELGQPLTALRALVGNARQFLGRQRLEEVGSNLDAIAGMVERMGRITSQLKSFARKSSGETADVSLHAAIDAACGLLQARIRDEGVAVSVEVPASARVRCDANRLEQVLVNLMANAMDAMRAVQDRRLRIEARREGDRTVVTVADSGPGIPQALRKRLFEPFFTTKPAGEGLGLGLVISASIVQEFGGALRAVAAPCGAAFAFDLASAAGPGAHA